MANHRMFSNRIANSARFLQMPSEAQLLYFHMVLRADDDGVVESYPLVRLLGVGSDNFKILLAKGFIEQLNDDQVIVILDWREHNKIRADRKVNSIYLPLLSEKSNIEIVAPKPRSDVEDNSKRLGGPSTVSISKVKLSYKDMSATADGFDTFWEQYPKKELKKKAKDIWVRKKLDAQLPTLMAFIEKAKTTDRWIKGYIKQPTTFLNNECWNDDLSSYGKTNEKRYLNNVSFSTEIKL